MRSTELWSPFQIVSSVSMSLWCAASASRVSERLVSVVSLFQCVQLPKMPLYARACVSVAILAPCRSNSFGISRSRLSGAGLLAPSLASLSLSSFPFPSCPLIHWKEVVAMRCFSMCAAFLKKGAFFIPIQPLSSHSLRCFVRPFMAYMESVMIFRGMNFGMVLAAFRIATTSPTWFDWWVPGILRAVFAKWSDSNHIPLPQRAFNFLLLKQALSVNTVTSCAHSVTPGV